MLACSLQVFAILGLPGPGGLGRDSQAHTHTHALGNPGRFLFQCHDDWASREPEELPQADPG